MNLRGIYIAHRGLHNKYNENTIQAFEEAINNNIPFELDVHLTKDNQLVVLHDRNLKRILGIDKNIDEIKYNQISNKIIKNTNQKIPLLKEVLELTNGKVLIDIEIKKDKRNNKIEKILIELLENYTGDIIIKSFNISSLLYLKHQKKKYMLGLLINIKNNKNIINVLYNKIILSALKVDFYCPNINMLPNNIINSKRKKYPIIAWTINSKEELEKAKKYADSYIFEDNII